MQITQLEYLIAVEKYGSISHAARELYTSQSSRENIFWKMRSACWKISTTSVMSRKLLKVRFVAPWQWQQRVTVV